MVLATLKERHDAGVLASPAVPAIIVPLAADLVTVPVTAVHVLKESHAANKVH